MIEVSAKDLMTALGLLKDIVPASPSVPAHAGVLITPLENSLELCGMDIGKSVKVVIPALVDNEKPFLLNLSYSFYPFISLASKTNDVFRFKIGRKLSVILEDDSVTNIPLEDVESYDFPLDNDSYTEINIDPESFVKSLNMTSFTNSKWLSLQMLHVFTQNGKLKLEATNGVAGGQVTIQKSDDSFDFGITGTIERPLKRMLGLLEDTWTVAISSKKLKVSGENWQIVFSTMSEKYPDMSNIYKSSNVNLLQLNREEIMNELGLLATVISDNTIHINVKSGTITLSAKGDSNRESVIAIEEGEAPNKVALNLNELQKILGMLGDDYFYMQLGNLEPVLFYENTERIYFTIPLSY